jgi:hypothetical protein
VSHNPPWKSETKTINPGSPIDFYDFVQLTGPKGGRVVIDQFILVVTGTITVATALWNGADVPRLFALINVEQRDGRLRWSLSGYKSRIMSIHLNGIEAHQEHGNVAVGAGQAIDLRLVIPMAKPFTRRAKDWSLPADALKKINVVMAPLGSAQTGTTVLSAASLSCYVLAEWHEEDNVEFKSEDLIKSVDFNSNTQAKIALTGVVHDLLVVKEGTTAGGDVITAITDARIEDLGTPVLTRQDLAHSYRRKRNYGASGPTTPATERFLEPNQSGMMLPVIAADPETSAFDGKLVESMKLDVGTGTTGLAAITREIVEKSQALTHNTAGRFGVNLGNVRTKTAGKTKRSRGEWAKRPLLVLPWSGGKVPTAQDG